MQSRTKAAVVAMAALAAASANAEPLRVRIGAVAPTSGGIAYIGQANQNGARLAIDELNRRGVTIGGRTARFELLAEDDAADPKQGMAVAQKLVDARVHGVVGHQNSGTAMPASRLYSEAGIPQVSPSVTNPQYTRQGFRTTFRLVADDRQLGRMLGDYAVRELKGRTFATIDDRTAYGQGLAQEFSQAVRAAGGAVVDQHFTTDKSTDFSAILTALKERRSDILFIGGMYGIAGPMIRQMKQVGLHARVMGGDGICSNELAKLAGHALADDQVICAEPGGIEPAQRVKLDRFNDAFRKRFGVEAEGISPYAYDAVNVMVDAMVKAGSAEPRVYLPVLAATQGYQGLSGDITFDEKGDLKQALLTLYTFRAGRREQIAVVRAR